MAGYTLDLKTDIRGSHPVCNPLYCLQGHYTSKLVENIMTEYEEYTESGNNRMGWFLIIMFAAFILGWAMVMMTIIKEPPRKWDYEILPDAPSQSIYSTREYKDELFPPDQIEHLPGAKILKETKEHKITVKTPEDTLK